MATYTRLLKRGSKGEDVMAVKQMLVALGYLMTATHNSFGSDTDKAMRTFQRENGLEADGIVGPLTWEALFKTGQPAQQPEQEDDLPILPEQYYPYEGQRKKGDKNDETVRLIQQRLLDLGYNLGRWGADGDFGADTDDAVRAFQRDEGLAVDGIVGRKTWDALWGAEAEETPDKSETYYDDIPDNIGIEARTAIAADLAKVSNERRMIVLEALRHAYDPATDQPYPRAFYIRGGNLYNTDLKLNVMTKDKLDKYLSTSSYKPYYDGGRDDMMRAAAEASGYRNAGADCSGMIIGLLRLFGYVSASDDATANGLAGSSRSKAIKKDALLAGDWVHYSGHIGIYVGGGYVVEFAGGAYGCQLTELSDRRCWDFVAKKMKKMTAWKNFRDPKYY